MKLEERKKKIEALRAKGLTYEKIGEQFGITKERIRQILTFKVEYCERHKRKFIGTCIYCKTEDEYVKKVKSILRENIFDQIFLLIPHTRKREVVMKRSAVIRALKDNYHFKFSEIAKLMERDLSTIKYLYKKQWTR